MNLENESVCEGDHGAQVSGKVEEEGRLDFGPWMLVRRRKFGLNSKGSHVGDQAPSPSPKVSPITLGVYSCVSKAGPYRSEHGVAQGTEGSSRSLGQDVAITVGSRHGVVPSLSKSVGSSQRNRQPSRDVTHILVPSFEFGSGGSPECSKLEGKVAIVGKSFKARNKSVVSAEAKLKGNIHGIRTKVSMGNFSTGEGNGFVDGNACANKSQSNHDMGLV